MVTWVNEKRKSLEFKIAVISIFIYRCQRYLLAVSVYYKLKLF